MSVQIHEFALSTSKRDDMVEITSRVAAIVREAGIERGDVVIHVPHTTAGVTINENADPDVVHDMLAQLDEQVPWERDYYRHGEGNSAAHVKASMMGSSVTVLVDDGRLLLGRWQGIWFCEFDGPRRRKCLAQIRCFT